MKYTVEYSNIFDILTVIKIFDFSRFSDDWCENKVTIYLLMDPKYSPKKNWWQ